MRIWKSRKSSTGEKSFENRDTGPCYFICICIVVYSAEEAEICCAGIAVGAFCCTDGTQNSLAEDIRTQCTDKIHIRCHITDGKRVDAVTVRGGMDRIDGPGEAIVPHLA